MRMKYPSIDTNALCDGLEHSIEPLSLQSFVYRGVLLYRFAYYDYNYSTYAYTFLRVDAAGNFYKVPLRNYPSEDFWNMVALHDEPLPSDSFHILTDAVYDSINAFCNEQHFRSGREQREVQTPIAIPQTKVQDPPLNSPVEMNKDPKLGYGFEYQYDSSYDSNQPCIALGFPRERTVRFYSNSAGEIHANFDGRDSYDYLIGRDLVPIRGTEVSFLTQGEYDAFCEQIKRGQYIVNAEETDIERELIPPTFYNGNKIEHKVREHISRNYTPVYFADNYQQDFVFRNVVVRDHESDYRCNFISNYFWDIEGQHYNSLVDRYYLMSVLGSKALNPSNTYHFDVFFSDESDHLGGDGEYKGRK